MVLLSTHPLCTALDKIKKAQHKECFMSDSSPLLSTALGRMKEAHRAAMAWLEKAAPALEEGASVSQGLLEGLVNEGSRLPVVMPQVKGLRERLAAARKLAEQVRYRLKS